LKAYRTVKLQQSLRNIKRRISINYDSGIKLVEICVHGLNSSNSKEYSGSSESELNMC